jgi:hypothetical protein
MPSDTLTLLDIARLSAVFAAGIVVGWISLLLLQAVFNPRRYRVLDPAASGEVSAVLVRKEELP